ncbi:GntR family transcriptional regulator [Paraburkholderia phenoliruptrix]|uniref:GntR family transcriptional regulator n=1 Tax=Paraburkholderia phenoliruptrix TaxID=252970 RepID=UPI001C6E3505|nr:GntR family transcriptional regulator [Paraburkholderia phenoliruptrix]MBW9102404.1 GntR family transcriptional regulator [Paraburkholderia phenoliruptrix]MBW9127625.1 GntR family transcriptional regulator [Paraburkholderia ginsengiterrae]
MEFAYDTMRKRILSGQYEPGTQLKEERLAEELGMSRTPIRAALKKLAEDKLVSVEANRGVFVAGWTRWDIEEMFSLRALLEPHAARLAAARATESDIGKLNEINAEMASAIKSRADDAVLRIQAANRAFHMHLLDCAKSQRLKSMLVTLIDMPVITRSFFLYSAPDFARSLQQHEDIAYAVQTHDGELACNLMESHIRLSYRRFMKERIDSGHVPAEDNQAARGASTQAADSDLPEK